MQLLLVQWLMRSIWQVQIWAGLHSEKYYIALLRHINPLEALREGLIAFGECDVAEARVVSCDASSPVGVSLEIKRRAIMS